MKITKIEVVQAPDDEGFIWLLINTDEGRTGLGEMNRKATAVLAMVQVYAKECLLGEDPRRIDGLWEKMYLKARPHGSTGAEMRAISAVDMALWDILGKSLNAPIWALLGGPTRYSVPVYYSGFEDRALEVSKEAYRDRAQELLDKGWQATKFGMAGSEKPGMERYLSFDRIEETLKRVEWIRDAVGHKLEVCIDMGGHLEVPGAVRFARYLEPMDLMWIEDPVPPDNITAVEEIARSTSIPICFGEKLATRYELRELCEKQIADVLNPDLAWTGGISELKRICTFAETYRIPVSPHDSGPVTTAARIHVMATVPNARFMEFLCHFYAVRNTYINEPLIPENGALPLLKGPGLGVSLSEKITSQPKMLVIE